MSLRPPPRRLDALLPLLLLAAYLLLTLPAVARKSASFDEQYHLAAGYSYLKTGDFRLATTHPPLVALVAALPLARDPAIVLPLDHPTWAQGNRFDFSDHFLWYANANGPELIARARLPVVLLGGLLLLAVYAWARRLFGAYGALLAGTLAAFDPNLIANARQVTTDLGVTLFLFLTFWRLWAWLERERWWDLLLAGLCAGAAMGAKYNGLLLWPGVLLVLLLHPPRPEAQRPGARHVWARRLGTLAAMALLALLVLWALYRFSFGTASVAGLALPLPAPFYWTNLWATFTGLLDEGAWKPDFLLGQVGAEGWWYYFPVAIAVKTPLPTLILCGAGLVALLRQGAAGRLGSVRRQAAAWVPPLLFTALALTGLLTIGYRHLLPALPFAWLLAGNNLRWAEGAGGRGRRAPSAVGGLLLLWLLLASVRFFPHHEAYFNELAGRWPNWSNILVDSNLDWGQDLPALREVMAQNGIERVNLAYFGKAVPEAYGVAYAPLPGYLRFMGGREPAAFNSLSPEPGWYAISATSLRLGTLQPDTVDLYAFFQARTPDLRAGYSIYLYKVPVYAERVVDAVLSGAPVWQQMEASRAQVPVQARWSADGATRIRPGGARDDLAADPSYRPVGANLGGVFALLGFAVEPAAPRPGETLRLQLHWQRGEAPMPMPAPARGEAISAFVHLTPGDPADVRAQFDGWDTALRGLLPGDVLVQPVEIALPPDLAPGEYQLLAGLYSPQDGGRLPLLDAGGEPTAGHAELGAVTVVP